MVVKLIKEHRYTVVDQPTGAVAQHTDTDSAATVDRDFATVPLYVSAVIQQSIALEVEHTPAQGIVRVRSPYPLAEVPVF